MMFFLNQVYYFIKGIPPHEDDPQDVKIAFSAKIAKLGISLDEYRQAFSADGETL